ncbi:hypothetical protein HD597_004562 [Nonomuraea thailandensis]|uniref:Uncharacterized protein n=1 Tax=Nonomuraea thailandensis TaxID=1188745 RepID=A0A9X2GFC8_9ACTN|nr:DUF6300 family protein [Nonomuraea thailandensis]MCP2357542.1 hypothetical protein [Nonomuraea thailandensis]
MSSVPPACPRCRTGEVLAVLRLPSTWTNASGRPVRGHGEVLLCARCDAGDPLVTYFAVHGTARTEHAELLARLLHQWLGRARPQTPDDDALRAETEAWHRGEL